MYGRTVRGIPAEGFERRPGAAAKTAPASRVDAELDAAALRDLVRRVQEALSAKQTGEDFPQEPIEQLDRAPSGRCSRSWNTERASVYRRQEHIADDLGTAVNVMAMVFGNLGPDSGTGVAFTRDPATGARRRLRRLPRQRAGRGRRRRRPQRRRRLQELERPRPATLRQLMRPHGHLGEALPGPVRHRVHHRARHGSGCCRPGSASGPPPPRSSSRASSSTRASSTCDEALRRVTGAQLAQLMFPRSTSPTRRHAAAVGVAASPGRGGRPCRLRLARAAGRRHASRSSWSGARPAPTTCPA